MSRIGKKPIIIPAGVTVTVGGDSVEVSGSKGKLTISLPNGVKAQMDNGQIVFLTSDGNLQGLAKTLVANAVVGVSEGWKKTLELNGTGYRAQVTGNELQLTLGYSHPVVVKAPEGVVFEVKENKITISGSDKMTVGQVAADVRSWKPVDPYKLKGLKYEGEIVIKKAGKAAKAGATTGK